MCQHHDGDVVFVFDGLQAAHQVERAVGGMGIETEAGNIVDN